MKNLIKNVTILTMDENNTVIEKGAVLFEGDKILQVGENIPESSADTAIDGKNGILMPGMINCHSHISMIPFRSMGDDCRDRLRRFLFPLENDAMTPELVYARARYAVCELLLSGVTTITDMYYFEDMVAKACRETGIRAFLGETVINQPVCDSKDFRQTMENTENFLKKYQNHPLVRPMVAPHATNTNTAEQLVRAKKLADKYGAKYTLHVSEMDYEMAYFKDTYNKTPVEFLRDLGVMDENTIAAHCIHLTDDDIDLFAKTGAKIAHCVAANTKSGKGVAPIYSALSKGVTVGIGTDGPSSGNTLDLFTQMRMIPLAQKTKYQNRSIMRAAEVVNMATIGGAKVLGIEKEVGTLEPGKKADMVLIETDSVNMFPLYNPFSALVYSARAENVSSVWVNGIQLVRDKQLVNMDLSAEKAALLAQMGDFITHSKNYKEYI